MVLVDTLVKNIKEDIEFLKKNNIINNQIIPNYSSIVRNNIHSWLQWAAIDSGRKLNITAVPEIKLYFKKPLDPKGFGVNKKKRNFIRADVAFYKNFNEFLGFLECVTLDEAHECFTSKEVNYKWLTAADKFPEAIKNLEKRPSFVIFIVILPKMVKTVPWKTGNAEVDRILKEKRWFESLVPKWKEMIDKIKEVEAKIIIVNEDDIICYP